MKIFNGTSHAINIFAPGDCVEAQNGRKLILRGSEVNPIMIIPPGENLNAEKGNKPAPAGDFGVPVVGAITFIDADQLPDGYDIYIVSNLFRTAYTELGRDTARLATVSGTVYADEESLRPCGCLELAIG